MFPSSLKSIYNLAIVLFLGVFLFTSCPKQADTDYLFRLLSPAESGIDFSNVITESEDFNILNFHYIYNGGGVGIADFNKDGLPDLVFSGNQVAAKVYLNKSELQFEDISASAQIETTGWGTGVSIIDINGDSWPDIYFSVGGLSCESNCKNQLFIHQGLDDQGIPRFQEMAAEYGLDDGLYTQQALFFDFDGDGDLDVYLLHNVIDQRDKNAPSAKHFMDKKSGDQLLENQGNGRFVDVSETYGIAHRGYGLGITLNDFNQDGLPDIYVANDFLSDDLLYLNLGAGPNGHKGFEEVSQQYLKHTSYNAMGVDVADINNDQRPDIFVLDMLPEYNERQKTMLGFMNYNKFVYTLRQGYTPQFIRNTLQIHNGLLQDELLPFSEVGYLAGVYNTDWSWTPLLADFDNDGDRDIYVTNGYGKDITDLDFINYSKQGNPFGTKESRGKELYRLVEQMEPVSMPNYSFENQGELQFQNRSGSWHTKQNSISNGAAYADLDKDGDLDLVVNNINEAAFVFENQQFNDSTNYLQIELQGTAANPTAIGAQVQIWTGTQSQTIFQSPVRGYLSSVEDVLHFGVGPASVVDSILVTHPVYGQHFLSQIKANQAITIDLRQANNRLVTTTPIATPLFQTTQLVGLDFQHQENSFQDFDAQRLLLQQLSRQGPCFAVANIDGQVGDELFVGGAKGFPGQIYSPQADGSYRATLLSHSESEDTAATFLDIDQDGDLDLYVVSGGTEFLAQAKEYQDRIYLNDGRGNFAFAEKLRSPANSSGSCVIASDFDQDGDIDLFVGGRVSPKEHPKTPRSYLLLNHDGRLLDYTDKLAYPLATAGMITDVIWTDYDQDGWEDLILVGEWMPITIYKNIRGHLELQDIPALESSHGLWNCIEAIDLDGDGDQDYLLGNLGYNSRLSASIQEPLLLYQKDFDQNGSPDPLLGQYYLNKDGERKAYPVHTRDDIMMQIPALKDQWVSYVDFSQVGFLELLGIEQKDEALLRVEQLASCELINLGEGQFELNPLPQNAQLAPVQTILAHDFDQNGQTEILLAGNDFTSEKNHGWYDASNGLLLRWSNQGWESTSAAQSGFVVSGDARELRLLNNRQGEPLLIAGQNSGPIKVFKTQKNSRN